MHASRTRIFSQGKNASNSACMTKSSFVTEKECVKCT